MMKDLIDVKNVVIGAGSVQAVSARELYLDLGHDYKKWNRWHKRNIGNNEWFIEGRDWVKVATIGDLSRTGQTPDDFAITLEFAKHIAMQSRTLKGHEYRNYLIRCEKSLAKLSADDERMLKITRINPQCLKAITGSRNNNEVGKCYEALELAGIMESVIEWKSFKRWRFTADGLNYCNGYHNDIPRFKDESHDKVMAMIEQVKQDNPQLSIF
jgi:phage anti-repressor protein